VPEVGHFLAAGIQGLHLTKFAIEFSPTLTNYKGKKVEYTLKASPSERLPEKIKAKLTCDHSWMKTQWGHLWSQVSVCLFTFRITFFFQLWTFANYKSQEGIKTWHNHQSVFAGTLQTTIFFLASKNVPPRWQAQIIWKDLFPGPPLIWEL
jgi:hypothetical protein